MGLKHGKRKRMESLGNIPDEVLASIGTNDIIFEKYDEQLIFDNVNKRLDSQQEKISNKE